MPNDEEFARNYAAFGGAKVAEELNRSFAQLEELLRRMPGQRHPDVRQHHRAVLQALDELKRELLRRGVARKAKYVRLKQERTRLAKRVEFLEQHIGALDALLQRTLASYRGYRETARAQIEALTREIRKLLEHMEKLERILKTPPHLYGTFVRLNDDGSVDVMVRGERQAVQVAPDVDVKALRPGQRLRLTMNGHVIAALPEVEDRGVEATVDEVFADGRVRLRVGGGENIIAFRSEQLREAKLVVGDVVLFDSRSGFIQEVLPKRESSELLFEDIPDVSFDEIGGQDAAIEKLRRYVERPMLYPEKYRERYGARMNRGVLLYGPPGCGKTRSLKALANELKRQGRKVYFLSVAGPQLLTMWVGETERKIREPFELAKAKAAEGAIVIVLFDEIDAMFPMRGMRTGDAGVSETSVTQFSTMLDGVAEYGNIIVIGTTNRPDLIDPALKRPGRLSPQIPFARPDAEGVRAIARIYLGKPYPIHPKYWDPAHPEFDAKQYAGFPEDRGKIVDYFVEKIVSRIFDETILEKQEVVTIEYLDGAGEQRTFYMKDLITGALIEETIELAKTFAIEDEIRLGLSDDKAWGLKAKYLYDALEEVFKSGEALPNLTSPQEWARILDLRENRPFKIVERSSKRRARLPVEDPTIPRGYSMV